MKNNSNQTKTKTTTVVVVLIIAVMFVTLGIVSAYSFFGKGHSFNGKEKIGFNNTLENEIQTAIKNRDYNSWKNLMESQLTQENFNKLVALSQNMTAFRNKIGNYTGNKNIYGNFTRFPRMNGRMRFGYRPNISSDQ